MYNLNLQYLQDSDKISYLKNESRSRIVHIQFLKNILHNFGQKLDDKLVDIILIEENFLYMNINIQFNNFD